MCLYLKYLVHPSRWRVETRCLVGYIFFQFPFLYILQKYRFGLIITDWRRRFDLRLSFILSKRVSLCSRYEFFCYSLTYFVPFGVIDNRVTKLNSGILMEIVTISVVLIDQFYFYMDQPIKVWLFEKIIFELAYLCILI